MIPRRLNAVIAVTAVLAAGCGTNDDTSGITDAASEDSGDSVPASPPADDDGAEPDDAVDTSRSADSGDSSSEDTGGQVAVSGFGDVAPECIETMVTVVQAIEPYLEQIDWANDTDEDIESELLILGELEATQDFNDAIERSVCGDLDFERLDGSGFALFRDVGREVAPVVLPWLEFTERMEAARRASGG